MTFGPTVVVVTSVTLLEVHTPEIPEHVPSFSEHTCMLKLGVFTLQVSAHNQNYRGSLGAYVT